MSDLEKLIERCEKQSENNAALTTQNTKLTKQMASILLRLEPSKYHSYISLLENLTRSRTLNPLYLQKTSENG